ncbi:MAG: alpha/beta hydrolase [Syntrophobacteria bacterium]
MRISGRDVSALDRPEVLQYLFRPRKDWRGDPPEGAMDFSVTVDEEVEVGLRFHLHDPAEAHFLLFHGNGEIASDYDSVGPLYNRRGFSLLIADYRGYGRSGGTPTATSLLSDAHTVFTAVHRWLEKQERTGPLFVMGQSLGSAPAIDVVCAFQDKVEGLILESAFARTIPLLDRLGVATRALGISEADGFVNFGKIKVIGKPTLIIHSPGDDLIPLKDADILLANSGAMRKELMLAIGSRHNNMLQRYGEIYFQTIGRFVTSLTRARKRRSRQGAFDKRYPRRC